MRTLSYAGWLTSVCLLTFLTLFFSCKKSHDNADNSEQNGFITKGVTFYKYPDPPADKPYPYVTPNYVFADSKGHVWVAYYILDEKAVVLKFHDGQWDRFYVSNTDVPWQTFVYSMAEDEQGNLYFLTMNADFGNRYLLRYRDGEWKSWQIPNAIPGYAFSIDKTGMLQFLATNQLSRIDPAGENFDDASKYATYDLSSYIPYAIAYAASSNGTDFFLGVGNRSFRIHSDGVVDALQNIDAGLAFSGIFAWQGTDPVYGIGSEKQLFKLNGDLWETMPIAEEDIHTALIDRVAVDHAGEVFLAIPAGFGGIGRYQDSHLRYYSYNGNLGIITYSIAVDSQNNKWAASQDGLYKIAD